MICAVNPRHLHIAVRVFPGTWNEELSFAWIIAMLEQYGTTGYGFVEPCHTLHVVEHHVGIVNVALNVVHIVFHSHMNVRESAAQILTVFEENTKIAFLYLVEHILPYREIHDAGND